MDLVNNSIIDGLRNNPSANVKPETNEEGQALNQSDFFALLTQQLSFQDPTKPVENDQMISQMTNFTMADGISNMNTNFESFAASMTSNQALQASSLVGQQVLVPGNTALKQGDTPIAGSFSTNLSAHNLQARIEDGAGQLIRTVDLGSAQPGKHRFEWDGLDNNGNPTPDGAYSVVVQGTIGNETATLPISTYAKVNSVSLGANGTGLTINTNNGSVKLAEIEEIGEG